MSFAELQSVAITDFKGPRLRLEELDVPLLSAKLALNVQYEQGSFQPRYGYTPTLIPQEHITSLYNWIKVADAVLTSGNALVFYNPTDGKLKLIPVLGVPVPQDLYTLGGGYGASIAAQGTRLYTAIFNAAATGQGQARVVSISGSSVLIDKAFSAPMATAPTVTQPGAGVVTQGLHRVGYYILSRSGFRGKLAPVISGTFTPSTITSTGTNNINFSLNATWPGDAAQIFVVMTTASNLNRWFAVPGASAAVTAGGTSTADITVNISDDELIATGKEVTDYMLWLTQDGSGNGPFDVSHVLEIGSRMGYVTVIDGISTLMVSEPGQYQQLTADQHLVKLPGDRQMTTAFMLPNGALYILGPNYTYATSPNGERPVLWPEPREIDGNIGTVSVSGVALNKSKGIAWVADKTGLYAFDGAYQQTPISYDADNDWKRINWAHGYTIQVVDDVDNQCVKVIVPYDGSIVPIRIFSFFYEDWFTSQPTVRYSNDSLTGYNPGAIAIVQSATTRRREVWLGRSTTGKILRQANPQDDVTLYGDDGQATAWRYDLAPMPGATKTRGAVVKHRGVRLRVHGQGDFTHIAYGLDGASQISTKVFTATLLPGRLLQREFALNSEAMVHSFTGNALSADYARISQVEHFYAPWLVNR